MKRKIRRFTGLLYSEQHHTQLHNLIVPAWSADELWGEKSSEFSFRNALVGSSEDCAQVWRKWLQQGTIVPDAGDQVYVLRHEFSYAGKVYHRLGAFVACAVEPHTFRVHEAVSEQGVENARDRYAACQADLTPIFAGVAAEVAEKYHQILQRAHEDGELILACEERPGAIHHVFRVADRAHQNEILKFLEDEQLYLLDGHHRWQGALQNARAGNGDGYILACVTSMSPTDLLILPIHRALVKDSWLLPKNSLEELIKLGCTIVRKLAWSPDTLSSLLQEIDSSQHQFYFLPVQSSELYLLELPHATDNSLTINSFEKLCDTIPDLHRVPVFGIPVLLEELASGQAQAGAFLPGLSAKEVCAVADRGAVLPRKSTRFYPKPALGLINRAWLDE